MPSRPAAVQISTRGPSGRAESLLGRDLRSVVAAFEHLNALAGKSQVDGVAQRIHAAEVGREDDDLLLRIRSPQIAEPRRSSSVLLSIPPGSSAEQRPDALAFFRQCHRHQRRGRFFIAGGQRLAVELIGQEPSHPVS